VPAAKLLEAEAHAALDRPDGRVQQLGDLRGGEAAEVGQVITDVGSLAGLEALLEAFVARAAAVVDERAPERVDRPVWMMPRTHVRTLPARGRGACRCATGPGRPPA
jgi:hypothetical protein